jgi:hypothetical protein
VPGRERALVHVEVDDAPVEMKNALQTFAKQRLVVTVLLLKVVLADQQSLGPERFSGAHVASLRTEEPVTRERIAREASPK